MYTAKILWVDLSSETTRIANIDGETLRKYLGGPGLAGKFLWADTGAETQPLSPENPLIFLTGPLTGTRVPGSGRYSVAAISPLTGIRGEAHSGGTLGYALRHTPFMGIGIRGKAKNPSYLWVDGEHVNIVNAEHLWGKDTFETDELLRKETYERAGVAAIGRAGERLVNIAAIMTDGRAARAAARCGLGAVMGSKNLKAVVVRGTTRPAVYDEEALKKSIREHFPQTFLEVAQRGKRVKKAGEFTSMSVVKNWTLGEFGGFDQKYGEARFSGNAYHCAGCPVGCFSVMRHGERNIHGEHCGPMGSNLLIDDMDAIYKAFRLCNRYGLDCISTGAVIGFGMELYEKGLITDQDTGGVHLVWGDPGAMLEMVGKIGEREGFGEVLGEGVKKAAERIGGNAREYAMHVKGLEPSRHDPRYQNATALIDATGSRGADHMEGYIGRTTRGYATPNLKDEEARQASLDKRAVAGAGKFTAWCQDFGNVLDAIGACGYLVRGSHSYDRQPAEPFAGVQPQHLAEWLNAVTGWDMDADELMRVGERIFNLKRLFNVRRGISRKDDVLPMRFLTLKRGGTGPAANNLPHLGAMLNEYYSHRGWSEEGIPTEKKLAELGLGDLRPLPWK